MIHRDSRTFQFSSLVTHVEIVSWLHSKISDGSISDLVTSEDFGD